MLRAAGKSTGAKYHSAPWSGREEASPNSPRVPTTAIAFAHHMCNHQIAGLWEVYNRREPLVLAASRIPPKHLAEYLRTFLRRAIYMPALVATRYNPDLKAKYDQLIAAGKPGKVAITAIMRKLLITANALLRDGRKWSAIRP